MGNVKLVVLISLVAEKKSKEQIPWRKAVSLFLSCPLFPHWPFGSLSINSSSRLDVSYTESYISPAP